MLEVTTKRAKNIRDLKNNITFFPGSELTFRVLHTKGSLKLYLKNYEKKIVLFLDIGIA